MADLPTVSDITQLAGLLAPGLIISSIRARAITGNIPDLKDRVFTYGVISVGYFAAIAPLFHVESGTKLPSWAWSFLQYFALPVLVGIVSAYAYQWRWSYRLAEAGRLHLAHHLPAAWDYAFESLPEDTYMLVTLNDGAQIAGRWSRASFAASNKDERDLLLGEVWEVGRDQSPWRRLEPPRSVLIFGRDIRTVEFLVT